MKPEQETNVLMLDCYFNKEGGASFIILWEICGAYGER